MEAKTLQNNKSEILRYHQLIFLLDVNMGNDNTSAKSIPPTFKHNYYHAHQVYHD